MNKKEREKQERLRQAKYEKEKATIENFRKNGAVLKTHLRKVGCDLPFYDFLDSYTDEFNRTVATAKAMFPSLVGVYEVDENEYQNTEWAKYGVGDCEYVLFDLDDRFSDYGKNKNPLANVRGSASFFIDRDNALRSVILIPRNPKSSFQHKEYKYVLKIGTLCHELGHIHDAENKINLDPHARRFDLIAGEAYANCYALERLAERHLVYTYNMLYDGMVSFVAAGGYEAEIGQTVLEKHEKRQFKIWNDYMDAATESLMKHAG